MKKKIEKIKLDKWFAKYDEKGVLISGDIKNILDKMQNHERKLVEKYIIKMNTVPFKKDGMGGIRFGFTIEDTGNGNNIS